MMNTIIYPKNDSGYELPPDLTGTGVASPTSGFIRWKTKHTASVTPGFIRGGEAKQPATTGL
jgi:hypothetical protein